MSITRLQQARQMYALGKLVERVGFRGGGMDMGNESNQAQSAAMGGGNNNNDKGSAGPETTRHNPHTDSGTSKTTTVTGKQMRDASKDFIQTLNTNNAIRAAQTGEKFSPFNNFTPTFAPKQQNKFGLFDLALLVASGGLLGPKIATGAKMFNTGKFAYDKAKQIGGLLETIGLTDKNVVDSFTDNLTSNFSDKITSFNKGNKSTTKSIKDSSSDREGIATLDNQAGNYDEYILLLQKLQSGNISDSERNRFNVLKNRLGI